MTAGGVKGVRMTSPAVRPIAGASLSPEETRTVPEEDVMFLDMPVEDGIKMVPSGGAFARPHEAGVEMGGEGQ
jgi:hypothetical protein